MVDKYNKRKDGIADSIGCHNCKHEKGKNKCNDCGFEYSQWIHYCKGYRYMKKILIILILCPLVFGVSIDGLISQTQNSTIANLNKKISNLEARLERSEKDIQLLARCINELKPSAANDHYSLRNRRNSTVLDRR